MLQKGVSIGIEIPTKKNDLYYHKQFTKEWSKERLF